MKAEEGAPKRANSQQKTSCNVYLLRSSFGNFCNGQNWASSRKNCARRRERDGVFRHGMTARYYGRGGYVSVTALRRYDRLSEKNSQGNPLLPLRSLLFLPRSGPPSLDIRQMFAKPKPNARVGRRTLWLLRISRISACFLIAPKGRSGRTRKDGQTDGSDPLSLPPFPMITYPDCLCGCSPLFRAAAADEKEMPPPPPPLVLFLLCCCGC